ncbi:MAG: TIGR03435 family protein [Terracidiphilus sp.]
MIEGVVRRRNCGWTPCVLTVAWAAVAALALSAQTALDAGKTAAQQQIAAAPLPAFEVVSIKPNKSGSMMSRIMMTPDGISVTGVPPQMLLREAFGVSIDRLVGGPGWMTSDRFDIDAKVAPEDAPKLKALSGPQRWAMFIPVFEDRFGLKFHHESRNLTQYVLVVSKSGLKMKEATPGNSYPDGVHPPSGGGGAGLMRMQPGELTGQAVPIGILVRQLSFTLGSTVVDQTGVTGKYDLDLKWTPDVGSGSMPAAPDGGQPGAATPPVPDGSGPSLFTALEEQLGLKLEARKVPADVIVIDHIDQPSPN